MTTTGRVQCPWDWKTDKALRSRRETLHIKTAMWAEPYEQEPAREADEKEFSLSLLWESMDVRKALDDATAEVVRDARRAGATWDEIARVFRVSRQAAQKRFGGAK